MADQVIVLPDPSNAVGPLLAAAGKVIEHEVRAVLVGGVAVICRLAMTHRVTLDADALAQTPGMLQILRTRADASPADTVQGVRLGGATVEVIEVQETTEEALAEVEDPKARLFVAAHSWAYETAEMLAIETTSGVRCRIRVATPAGLVATKTHAFVGRPTDDKTPSDLYDLLLLVEQYDVVAALAAAPANLRGLVRHFLGIRLTDDLERLRVLRLCRQAGLPDVTEARLDAGFADPPALRPPR